jgi:hypothetical protein
MKRQQHDLNEAECGYRSGNKATALPNEPRFEYDPEETTLNQRLEAKSKETGIAVRTLWRFKNEYRKRGIYALVDLRQVRETKSQFDPRIVQALRFVLAELRDKSNVTRKRIIECPSRPTASPHSTTPPGGCHRGGWACNLAARGGPALHDLRRAKFCPGVR